MSLDATLRLLTKASGLTAADLAAAIPRAGVSTVKAWLAGEKMPGSEQLNALARAFGVPAGALLSELASTLDPARTQGEHDLLAAYRALNTRQLQRARRRQPGHAAARYHDRCPVHYGRCGQLQPLRQALPEGAQAMTALQRHATEAARQILQPGRWLLAAGQARCAQSAGGRQPEPVAPLQISPHQCSTLPHSRS